MQIHITLSETLKAALDKHVNNIGITTAEYIRGLIKDDLELGKNTRGRPQKEKIIYQTGDSKITNRW